MSDSEADFSLSLSQEALNVTNFGGVGTRTVTGKLRQAIDPARPADRARADRAVKALGATISQLPSHLARGERCGARNDLHAPYEREFDVGWDEQTREEAAVNDLSNAEDFSKFDQFDEAAKGISDGLFEAGEESLLFVVEGGIAACDNGGELAHHRAAERGVDPVDDQEREEIDDEVRRVVGAFGGSFWCGLLLS
jgi:hypothetical protein